MSRLKEVFTRFKADKSLLLYNDDYFTFLIESIRNAKKAIYITMFIITVADNKGCTRAKEFIDELVCAGLRGVSIKVVLGDSEDADIKISNLTSFKYMAQKGVPVRYFSSSKTDSSVHSKYAIIDGEFIVVGSHNWTRNALTVNNECSIAVFSKEAAMKLSAEFFKVWESAKEECI